MGDIVNLKRARKQLARAGKDAQAAENRARFGQSRQVKDLAKAKRDKETRRLDEHKREP